MTKIKIREWNIAIMDEWSIERAEGWNTGMME
jgi:hypothetical protein